jgi:hypothetical protein
MRQYVSNPTAWGYNEQRSGLPAMRGDR